MKTYPTEVSLIRPGVRWARWLSPCNLERPDWLDHEIRMVQKFIKPGDTVVDIGAYTGDTTVAMAICARPGGCAVAFEPNPSTYEVLLQNARLNPVLRIFPHQVAITGALRHGGPDVFHYSDDGYCNGGKLLDVPDRKVNHAFELLVETQPFPIDLLHDTRLSFIKIDAEGSDPEIFAAIAPVLRTRVKRPVVKMELFPDLDLAARKRFHASILEHGYRPCYESEENEEMPLDEFLRHPLANIICLPCD